MAAAAGQDGPRRLTTLLKLGVLAILGIGTVSLPVTLALVLSATGASDVLTIGTTPQREHASPAAAVERSRCVATHGYYALTFEGGPDAATTRRLVAVLERSRAVATFFDVGRDAARRLDLVELQRTVGQVASNGYSGTPLTALTPEQRIAELQATAHVLDYPNAWVRPPLGLTDAAVDADVRRSGLTPVYWTAADAGQVRPGGIIRLDERAEATLELVPRLVRDLRERGLCPGFLDEAPTAVSGANGVTFHVQAVKP